MHSLRALALTAACFAPLVRSVNMTFYDLNAELILHSALSMKSKLSPLDNSGNSNEVLTKGIRLLETNEDPSSTTDLIDFFAPDGTQIVLQNAAVGGAEIIALKQAILPVDGSVRWNHFPNITFVAEETSANKTFQLSGILHVIAGANCSTTYFSTRFTVTKNAKTGIANLETHSRSLLVYHGFRVESSEDPCFATY
ncbi:hypothetical protein DL95DRAFT_488960 [Leptodontidium sp. 2 PMI_412]|nr:hypothetical protein DL95DRAFT_488960 [Leptodontidium sp. 2 PMI_412]